MKKHIEKEYKIKIDKETYQRLLKDLDIKRHTVQINHYYSAPKDMGIRIREEDGTFEFTLKVKKADHMQEYNIKLIKNDVDDPEVKRLLANMNIEGIHYLGDLKTTRSDVCYPKAVMSIDKSEYLGMTDYEIEYELLDHEIDDIDDLKEVLKMNDIKMDQNTTKYGRFMAAKNGKAAIFCADGLEECEALIVMDLLKRAGLHVDLVAMEGDLEVVSSHGLHFKADILFEDMAQDAYDALILPGGLKGTETLSKNEALIALLRQYEKDGKLIAAICAAPSIFVKNGLVKDDGFTVYPGFECGLTSTGEKATVVKNVITGKGVGAAFEFSYEIIKKLLGEEKAEAILKETQYR